jgi:hypothetical protein
VLPSVLSVQLQGFSAWLPLPDDVWAGLWDLRPPAAPARLRVRLALHADSFDADSIRLLFVPLLLDPLSFLQGRPRSYCDAVCSVLATFVRLVGASLADAVLPVGSCVFASGLSRRSLSALTLPPAPRVAEHCPVPFFSAWGAEAEAPLGYAVVLDLGFFQCPKPTNIVSPRLSLH